MRRNREIVAQPPLGGGPVEHVACQRRHRRQFAEQGAELAVAIKRVGDDRLVRIDARERRRHLGEGAFHHHEFRRRDVDPGEPDAIAARGAPSTRDRKQIIVGAGIEQRVFGQRARRDQPHHITPHHALVAAGARFRRVFHLLADRDAETLLDQPVQIVVGALHRHAAHRNVHALMLAALGQHDAERLRGALGVFEEQFVEVAHPVEQQQPRMGGLDLEVLLHHRRDAGGGLRARRGVGRRRRGNWNLLLDRHGRRKLANFVVRSYRFTRRVGVFHPLHDVSSAPRTRTHAGPRANALPGMKPSIDLLGTRS